MTPRLTIVAALAVAALQIGFLSSAIIGRAAVLRDGKEVLVKVEPVDPRDLLRGDYVRLGYDMARLQSGIIANYSTAEVENGMPITVRLARQADGQWQPAQALVADSFPSPGAGGEVDLSGTITYVSAEGGSAVVLVDYGVERFYLPEGEGRQIEQDMRERPFFVKLAVAKDGTAQIKQFLDGDKVLYEEPPY